MIFYYYIVIDIIEARTGSQSAHGEIIPSELL